MFYRTISLLIFFSFLTLTLAQNNEKDNSSYLNPVKLELKKDYYKLGNVYMGEQPDSAALAWFVENGVDKVINLRSKKENKKFAKKNFSMEKASEKYGIKYKSIPISGDEGYTPESVKEFAEAISDTNMTYLVHCNSGTRANYMWIAYLTNYENIPLNDAVNICRKMKIKFPFEGLLGYPIKIEKDDK